LLVVAVTVGQYDHNYDDHNDYSANTMILVAIVVKLLLSNS